MTFPPLDSLRRPIRRFDLLLAALALAAAGCTSGGGGAGGGGGSAPSGPALVTGLRWPGAMVVDGQSLVLTSGADTEQGTLVRVAIGSWAMTTLAGDASFVVDAPLAADAENIYFFAEQGGGTPAVYAYPRAGGAPIKITDAPDHLSGLAVDADRVYFVDLEGVKAAPLAGGPPTTFATPPAGVKPGAGLAVDATNVYWSTSVTSTSGSPMSGVFATPRAGGATTQIASVFDPVQIVVDGGWLSVLDDGMPVVDCGPFADVIRVPVGGGASSHVTAMQGGAQLLASSGKLYVTETGTCCDGDPGPGPSTTSCGSIDEAPLDSGSAKPVSGSLTPGALAADAAGKVYVAVQLPGGVGIVALSE